MANRANNYVPYQTVAGPLAADNEATALDVGTIVISSGGTAESATIPSGARLLRIQCDTDFWYDFNATATIPSGDDASGSPIYIPAGERRYIHFDGNNDTFSAIASATGAVMNLVFWS